MEKRVIIAIIVPCAIVLLLVILLLVAYSMLRNVDKKYQARIHKEVNGSAKLQNEFLKDGRAREYLLAITGSNIDNNELLGLMMEILGADASRLIEELDKHKQAELDYDKHKDLHGTGSLQRCTNWIAYNTLNKHKMLCNTNILVKMAAKIFRNFPICIIDRQISFFNRSSPKCQRNVFIAVSRNNAHKIYQLHVDDAEKTLEVKDKLSVTVKEDENLAVAYGLISVLRASST